MWTSNLKIVFQGLDPGGGGEGELPYNSDGDTHHLTLGCRLQVLVSIRVFGMESHFICPLFRYFLILYIKKFTKNVPTLTTQKSSLGVSLSLSHTHNGLP